MRATLKYLNYFLLDWSSISDFEGITALYLGKLFCDHLVIMALPYFVELLISSLYIFLSSTH